MKIAGRSDIGLVRANNQDNYLITKNNKGDILALVCDGIGGAKAGDVASLIATRNIGESFSQIDGFLDLSEGETWLKKVLNETNDLIYSTTATTDDYAGMGTTFVGALFINNEIIVANVGDSRAYVLEKDHLKQVTIDHSLVYELAASGKITVDEIENHPQRNVLTNALGVVGSLRVDTFIVAKGEKLLLCTDGLSGYVKHADLFKIINNNEIQMDQTLEALITKANSVGGYDNVTIILADLGGFFHE